MKKKPIRRRRVPQEPKPSQLQYYKSEKSVEEAIRHAQMQYRVFISTLNAFPDTNEAQDAASIIWKQCCTDVNLEYGKLLHAN